jgi:hypothetical protein
VGCRIFDVRYREFEVRGVRRDGITMPLPPGEYQYEHQIGVNGGVARVSSDSALAT